MATVDSGGTGNLGFRVDTGECQAVATIPARDWFSVVNGDVMIDPDTGMGTLLSEGLSEFAVDILPNGTGGVRGLDVRLRLVTDDGLEEMAFDHLRIEQDAGECSYSANPVILSYDQFPTETQALGNVRIETQRKCPWDATKDKSWVTWLGPTSGSGPGIVRYRVADSFSSDLRRAKIRVNGAAHDVLQKGYPLISAFRPTITLVVPTPPGGRPQSSTTASAVRLRWRDRANNETGFIVRRGPTTPMVYTLAADRETFLDRAPEPGAKNCYTIVAFNDAGRSGPAKVCIDVPANGESTVADSDTQGPHYVSDVSPHVRVDDDAGKLPNLPTVRIYKAYEAWGEPGVENALEARGYIHGESLFVRPIKDLAVGIPDETAVVIVPSASDGNLGGQVRVVNSARARRSLRRFASNGGAVILHRWSEGGKTYRVPVKGKPSSTLAGYDVYEIGEGAAYATVDAVDHPLAGALGRNLDRLLREVLRQQ